MTPIDDLRQRLGRLAGSAVVQLSPLSGGCVGTVYRAELAGGSVLVVKTAGPRGTLEVEGFMLRYLGAKTGLPVPRVIHAESDLLVMEYIDGESRFGAIAERHAAELLAALHRVRGPSYGFERDTLIGGLHQPNPPTTSWVEFFGEQRLRYMAREAQRERRLTRELQGRVECVARRLPELLDEPEHPSLIHGDVWGGNVLARGDRVAEFLDPAISFAHPEIELAFITLFSTFGRAFFGRYEQLRPIRPGFFEVRRHVYNLYPLLVHVRLFGGGYVGQLASTLDLLEA